MPEKIGTGSAVLLDRYLPEFSFREVHSVRVFASPDAVIQAASLYQPETDIFFRSMIGLREAPTRFLRIFGIKRGPLLPPFGMQNFTQLQRIEGTQVVYGLVGRFWRTDYGLVDIADAAAFKAFNNPGTAKLILSFAAHHVNSHETELVTETRVFCPDRACLLRFAPYWYLIRPVSGLIRKRILNSIKRSSEIEAA